MSYGNVKVVGADQALDSAGLVNSLVLIGPVRLYSVTVFNTGPDQYIQLFIGNLPANGTVPSIPPIKVLADSQGSIDFGDGRAFNGIGVAIGNSSQAGTRVAGAADCFISITYRKTEN